jgi:hypothetical protein
MSYPISHKYVDDDNYKFIIVFNNWKVFKYGAGEGWRRSVGPIM